MAWGCGCSKNVDLGVLLQGYSGMEGLGDLDPNAIMWPSRGELDNETQKLQAAVKQLGQDWFNSDGNSVSQTELTAWNSFVSDVQTWDWGPSWLAHLIDATWRDDLLTFENRFNTFLDAFRSSGVSTTVPAFTFAAAPPSTLEKLANAATKPLADTANTIKWVGIGIGAVVIGYVFFLTFQTGKTARALAPMVTRNPRRRRRRR
jgi:hypothetical protein